MEDNGGARDSHYALSSRNHNIRKGREVKWDWLHYGRELVTTVPRTEQLSMEPFRSETSLHSLGAVGLVCCDYSVSLTGLGSPHSVLMYDVHAVQIRHLEKQPFVVIESYLIWTHTQTATCNFTQLTQSQFEKKDSDRQTVTFQTPSHIHAVRFVLHLFLYGALSPSHTHLHRHTHMIVWAERERGTCDRLSFRFPVCQHDWEHIQMRQASP